MTRNNLPTLKLTVRPDVEVVLAQTYTARGATLATACSIWLFPSPGSPTISTWGSPRTGIRF